MRRIASLAIILAFAATATVAQEAPEEPMYVSLTYVNITPGMTQAFMAAAADHLEWHKSTNDTHYYTAWQVASGPRTGQVMFVSGPMTGEALDEYNAFNAADMQDWAGRGGFNYVEGVETIMLRTLPQFGNPPPPGTSTPMVHVYELELEHGKIGTFMEALEKMDGFEKAAGPEDTYSAWVMPVSGTSFAKRWAVVWVDGWADTSGEDAERQAKLMEAAGGQEAFQEVVATLMGSVTASNVTTYMALPEISFPGDSQ